MEIAAYVERLDFIKRHLRLAAPYLTAAKVANLLLNEAEYRLGRRKLKSLPPFIKLESTPLCHLACPGCVHSIPGFKKSLGNKKHLSFELVRSVVEPIAHRLLGTSLSYSGEPLLNKELFDIVQYLHSNNIYTSFPTNLSVPMSEEYAERVVRSGLDLMMISLDGASAETYSKFRIGGRFDLVRENVRLLAAAKKRLGKKRPYLLWKFVVFSHNSHEIAVARSSAKDLGFDGIEFDSDNRDEKIKESVATNVRAKSGSVKPCYWAWNTATITWDGDAQSCCQQMNQISLGNVSNGFADIWNSKAYQELRRSFTTGNPDDLHKVCRACLGLTATSMPDRMHEENQSPKQLLGQ